MDGYYRCENGGGKGTGTGTGKVWEMKIGDWGK